MSDAPPRFNVMMVGMPGSGRTTMAQRIAHETSLVPISYTSIQRQLKKARTGSARHAVWEQILKETAEANARGLGIIYDDLNLTQQDRHDNLIALSSRTKGVWMAAHMDVAFSDIVDTLTRESGTMPDPEHRTKLRAQLTSLQPPSLGEGFSSIMTFDINGKLTSQR